MTTDIRIRRTRAEPLGRITHAPRRSATGSRRNRQPVALLRMIVHVRAEKLVPPAYQGENIIALGNGIYWGYPGGSKSEQDWIKLLIDEYNSGLAPAAQIKSIPGFSKDEVYFFDVPTIGMRAFDLRNGKKP